MDKKTILFVDDNKAMRYILKEFLAMSGYSTIICEDGKHAIPHINSADMLITDLNMPGGISGVELTKIAKRKKPGMPVMIMTGAPTDIPANHVANEIIEKPFDVKRLRKVISDLLRR